jgi:hypothetical protein
MIEKKIVKTVRFKAEEMESIDAFLRENPALDFSTLLRLAVAKFITAPTLNSLHFEKAGKASPKENLWN